MDVKQEEECFILSVPAERRVASFNGSTGKNFSTELLSPAFSQLSQVFHREGSLYGSPERQSVLCDGQG